MRSRQGIFVLLFISLVLVCSSRWVRFGPRVWRCRLTWGAVLASFVEGADRLKVPPARKYARRPVFVRTVHESGQTSRIGPGLANPARPDP